jgi:YtkA-like
MLRASILRTHTSGLSAAEIAAVLLSAAGAIHVGAAPQHWSHSPAHGLFLLAIGLGDLVWAALFWRRPTSGLALAGAALAGGSIVLWAVTRVLPAPFGHGAEAVGVTDVASKLPEVLALGVLLARPVNRPTWGRAAGGLGVATAAGVLTFWLATAAQPVLPWLGDSSQDEGAVDATAPAGTGDRLQVVVAGIGAPLASDQELPVAGDLLASIAVSPAGARFRRELDVHLVHAGGAAASDATIVATGHMRFMDHGSFRQAATRSSAGHYALPIAFAMPGEWQIDLEIATPSARGGLQLDLDLID